MDSSKFLPLRALPRVFLESVSASASEIELPESERDKFRKVLRLEKGDQIAVLPNDGTIIRCEYQGKIVVPVSVEPLNTESSLHLTLIQALPKMDRLENIVRMCTEIGVARFVLFPSDRSVVKWDSSKLQDKVRRLAMIARESAEVSFRAKLPVIECVNSFQEMVSRFPKAYFLSEQESVTQPLEKCNGKLEIVVGPEGGWSPREIGSIGDRALTLGPRVLRVDTASIAACSMLLCSSSN